jgi:hypothetical protein
MFASREALFFGRCDGASVDDEHSRRIVKTTLMPSTRMQSESPGATGRITPRPLIARTLEVYARAESRMLA